MVLVEHEIFVDGMPKGKAFRRHNRWWWRRNSGQTEPMPAGAKIHDVAEWARKCCNGKRAEINCGNGRRAKATQ